MPTENRTAPTNALLAAALVYAARGWRVFPVHTIRGSGDAARCSCGKRTCDRPGKHPRTEHGLLDASTDTNQLAQWWSDSPDSNVGVVTGGGLIVIDIDPKRADDGLSAFESSLPQTPTAITGSGGRHYFFRVSDGVEIRNSVNKLAPGVDVRGDGGYVVVAPSTHVSGGTYEWDAGAHIEDTADDSELAELPDFILRTLSAKAPRLASPSDDADKFVHGGRNDALTSLAGSMRKRGMSEAGILAALLAENDARCVPPLDPKEVQRIAKSVARYAPAPTPRAPPAQDGEDTAWRTALTRDAKDNVKAGFANLCLILRHHHRYAGGLSYNTMALTPMLRGKPLADGDIGRIREEIERDFGCQPTEANVIAAIRLVAEEDTYHPVQRYLSSLAWDGATRIDGVPAAALGVDDDMARIVVRRWFISAVARAMQPGCKVDTVLVLVGKQGKKKSTFFRVLGGEWFSDTAMDITNKDAFAQLAATWIYEWAEIERVTLRRESSDVKGFITSAFDTFRPSFGRAIVRNPRSVVIVGSTNEEQFLADATGSRRWWIVEVENEVDVEFLTRERDQLWAEAVAAYNAGERWWLNEDEEAKREALADANHVEHPWTESVLEWAAARGPRSFTARDVLSEALKMPLAQQKQSDWAPVGRILRRAGYAPRRTRVKGQNAHVWEKVQNGEDGSK